MISKNSKYSTRVVCTKRDRINTLGLYAELLVGNIIGIIKEAQ